MSRRSNLYGVTHSLLGSFVSRNNDVEGYWALGMLRWFLERSEALTVCFDVLNGISVPSLPGSVTILSKYRQLLIRLVERVGLSPARISSAEISIQFDIEEPSGVVPNTYGKAFVAKAVVVDDLGKEYTAIRMGWCAPHNNIRELRSTRY